MSGELLGSPASIRTRSDTMAKPSKAPKLKTKKALAKRLKVTKNGKIKRQKAGRGHLMSHKSGKRRRHLRKPGLVEGRQAKTYLELLRPGR